MTTARTVETAVAWDVPHDAASGSRRRALDARPADVRAAQIRAVGTAFLRVRPLVVAPVAVVNAILLAASGAPVAQRAALGIGLGSALGFFIVERVLLRRRVVSERWLATSLAVTSVLLAVGCALSGGIASPLIPFLLAPAVIAASAFGRTRTTLASLALTIVLAGVLAAGLAIVPPPWPPLAAPWSHAMAVCAVAGVLALVYAGVASLGDAHARTSEVLDRMRLATIEEAASRMRATEQIGAKVAHELKNPLAGIRALLQLVHGGELPAKATERLGVALGEVDRMDGIVRDYLAFARPLAELAPAAVDVRALADDVASVLAGRAERAGIALAVDGRAPEIVADARRVREALYNLVDNAIAATPARGTVAVAIAGDERGVRVTIDDTGPGIDPDIAAAITPFVTTKPGGTGLGLVIARAAIAQHGGTLALARRDRGGTRATVVLPHEPGGPLP